MSHNNQLMAGEVDLVGGAGALLGWTCYNSHVAQ